MFTSRQDAGHRLGALLVERHVQADRVLGLARGGVVVAAGVARALHAPLDVLLVRKIGHPQYREFALGALAEGNVVVWNEPALRASPVPPEALEAVLEEERRTLQAQRRTLAAGRTLDLNGQRVVLVDDGLATGSSMEAAVASARRHGAARVIVAVPVASDTAFQHLSRVADEVQAVLVDPDFTAVGAYYARFPQTTEEEVLALLRAGRSPRPPQPGT